MEGEEKNREKYVHTFHDYLNFCKKRQAIYRLLLIL